MNKKFVVQERRIIGQFDNREDAWDYLDLMKKENPESIITWHVEEVSQ